MRPKKKEKENPSSNTENNEADLEKFLYTFEKPTRIYRYLRTRHLVSPIFLQRSLHYMKQRSSVSNAARKTFKVDSLLEKKKVTSEEPEKSCSGCKYLRLDLQGFYDEQIPPDIHEVEVEAILTRIQQARKSYDGSPKIKQTSLGKVKIPVNPNWNQSSLDGTQSDNETVSTCGATLVCKDGFSFQPNDAAHSYSLHLSVTCHLNQCLSNGVSNGDVSSAGEQPQPKKRRSSAVRSRSSSLEGNVVVYGTELSVYGKQYQCVLKTGTYDLILQEVGSKFSTQDSQWEKAGGKRPIDALEVFETSPTLKLYLGWTNDAEGQVQCKVPPCEFVRNNQYSKTFSDIDSSELHIKEEGQLMPEKIFVTYQFLYNENTRQQTDTRDNMHCPWCSLNCEKLYSLLKHLRLSHARFNIIYCPTPSGHRIDVTLNDCFDGAYAGNPQDLNSHIGFAFHRLGPVRRTSITHVMVYRPKRPAPSLQEFFEPEKENQVSRQIIQGHNRLYYRTNTCMPLKPQETCQDSEDENTPQWLCQKSVNLIDEFTDVNEGEKELMKMWNLHCMKYAYIADCQIPQACASFVEEHGREIVLKDILKNFAIHLVNMFDYSLITPDIVQRTMWQLYTVRDDLEMSGQIPCTS